MCSVIPYYLVWLGFTIDVTVRVQSGENGWVIDFYAGTQYCIL